MLIFKSVRNLQRLSWLYKRKVCFPEDGCMFLWSVRFASQGYVWQNSPRICKEACHEVLCVWWGAETASTSRVQSLLDPLLQREHNLVAVSCVPVLEVFCNNTLHHQRHSHFIKLVQYKRIIQPRLWGTVYIVSFLLICIYF